jgi:hypothetical protein
MTAKGRISPSVGGGDDVTRDQWDAQTAEIARLMDFADGEDAAIQQLEADVAAIRRVHAARTASRTFTASELREALDLRHKRLPESVS